MATRKTIKKYLIFLLALVFLNPVTIAWSDDTDTETLRTQQQKLRQLLDRIGETQEQNEQQKDTIKKLEKKMSCNWELLQAYEACEKNIKDNLEAQINCKQEARKKATKCLSFNGERQH